MEENSEQSPGPVQKPNENTERPKLSRRRFLMGLGATALSTPFILEGAKNALIEGISEALVSNNLSEKVNDKVAKIIENVSDEENPDYRPIMSQIFDAINSYQTQTGNNPTYEKDSSFRPNEYYKDLLDALKAQPFYKIKSNDFARAIISSFDERQKITYDASFNFFVGLQSAACPGSGYYSRLKSVFGETLDANLSEVTDIKKHGEIEALIFQDMNATKLYIEELSSKEQKPVSSSKLLEHFLVKNRGNIAEAMYDTGIFLKFMTRNNIDKRGEFVGDKPESVANIDWMKKNILDEFKGPSYQQTDSTDQSMLNLIGKPYHSWFLVSLLQFFPTSVIQSGCYYELFRHIDEHGLAKINGDISTLSELNKVEQYLSTFSTNK